MLFTGKEHKESGARDRGENNKSQRAACFDENRTRGKMLHGVSVKLFAPVYRELVYCLAFLRTFLPSSAQSGGKAFSPRARERDADTLFIARDTALGMSVDELLDALPTIPVVVHVTSVTQTSGDGVDYVKNRTRDYVSSRESADRLARGTPESSVGT